VSGGALGGGRMVEDSSRVAGIFLYFLFPCNLANVLKLLVYKIYTYVFFLDFSCFCV